MKLTNKVKSIVEPKENINSPPYCYKVDFDSKNWTCQRCGFKYKCSKKCKKVPLLIFPTNSKIKGD